MNTNIQREKLIYRYFCALERGDLDTVGSVFAHAEHDEALAAMIDEAHKAMITEEDRAILETMRQDFRAILRAHGLSL